MRIPRALAASALQPVGLSLLLAVTGIVLRQPWVCALGAALLWLLSTPAVSDRIIGALEREFPFPRVVDAPAAGAVVVIGGNIIRGLDRTGIHWGPSASRFNEAIRLLRAGKAPFLILAAADSPYDRGRSQADILCEAAVESGVPRECILSTPRITNSAEEIRAVAGLCRERNITSAIVVTSGWHMPRIMLLFRGNGLRVLPFPVDKRAPARSRFEMSHWLPGARALADSEAAVHEFAALAWYTMRSSWPTAAR